MSTTGRDARGPERAYRAALRAYPRRWRAARGEELLGVLLDVAADQGRRHARPGELAGLVAHGLGARLAIAGVVLPRPVRARAAALGLAGGFALSVVFLLFAEWGPWLGPWTPYGPEPQVGPFCTLGPLVYAGWLVAFAAAAVGRPALARALCGVTLVAACAVPPLATAIGLPRPPLWLLAFLALLAGVAALGPVTARAPLLAGGTLTAGAGVLAVGAQTGYDASAFYLSSRIFPGIPDFTWLGLALTGVLALAVALLATGHRAWAGAVVIAALPWWSLSLLRLAGLRLRVERTRRP